MSATPASTRVTMDVVEAAPGKPRWRLLLDADALTLEREGGGGDTADGQGNDGATRITITREQLPQKTLVIDGLITRRTLEVDDGQLRLFRFNRADFERFQRWVGPPDQADVANSAAWRVWYMTPIGVLHVLASLPTHADASRGVEAQPIEPVGLVLGVLLVLLGMVMRVTPRPTLFLVEALLFLSLGCVRFFAIGAWHANELWLMVAILELYLAAGGFDAYRRYRGVV